MPFTPTFSVTPLDPFSILMSSASNVKNHIAHLTCFGVYFGSVQDKRLEDQYLENKAVLFYNAIDTPAPTTIPILSENSAAFLTFRTKANQENQYLLIYHVSGMYNARAAFYLNGNLIRSEEVNGIETIAILVDCPPPDTLWYAAMFLEGTGCIEFKGIECFVL